MNTYNEANQMAEPELQVHLVVMARRRSTYSACCENCVLVLVLAFYLITLSVPLYTTSMPSRMSTL